MPTFNLTLAVSVQAYGHVEIEADTMEAALEIARAQAEIDGKENTIWDSATGVEWDTQSSYRVCSIENASAPDETLDDIHLTNDVDGWKIIGAGDLKIILAEIKA